MKNDCLRKELTSDGIHLHTAECVEWRESASGGKGSLTRDSLLTFSTDFGDVVHAQLLKIRRWPDNFLTSESKKDIMRLYEKYSSPSRGIYFALVLERYSAVRNI